MKRLFDIACSGAALLVLSPLFLVVMLILRLTGEGNVFYRQYRIGYKAEKFAVLKFATMLEKSESQGTGHITVRNDPRVLPVGRVLRKTKINELPQLLNILKGDMSIVGWRPLMPTGFAYYPEAIQKRIVTVKPGLTGIGSIVFRDEEGIVERSSKTPQEVYSQVIGPYKGALEMWYIDRQSFWLDMKIIFVTALVVLAPGSTIYQRWFSDLPDRPTEVTGRGPANHEPSPTVK